MGNNCCNAAATTNAAVSQDKPTQATREGELGLLDLGYQYRLYETCSKHQHDIVDTKPASTHISLFCTECSIRLFQLQEDGQDALVNTSNRKEYIPPRIYDRTARLAQQLVINWLKSDYQLESLPLFQTPAGHTVHALVSPLSNSPMNNNTSSNSTLIIINGRGVARAGILSTRHTVESGIEKGSALYHIHQGLCHNMNIVCVDSNAQGSAQGLDTVCQSLNSPALAPYLFTTYTGSDHGEHRQHQPPQHNPRRDLYVLCHSAGGGNFVQLLLQNDTRTSIDAHTPNNTRISIDQIKALAFTDSTHDMRWLSLKSNPKIMEFLQCDTCLYIRNNREHVKDTFGPKHQHQKAGELFDCSIRNVSEIMDNSTNNGSIRSQQSSCVTCTSMEDNPHQRQWRERFGNIRTVYAGTDDHSLMCFEARKVIWDFFESKMASTSLELEDSDQNDMVAAQQSADMPTPEGASDRNESHDIIQKASINDCEVPPTEKVNNTETAPEEALPVVDHYGVSILQGVSWKSGS